MGLRARLARSIIDAGIRINREAGNALFRPTYSSPGPYTPNLVVAPWEQTAGQMPELPLKRYLDWSQRDPHVKTAVDNMVAHTVGEDIFVTGENPKAVEILEQFNDDANAGEWLQYAAREEYVTGNHMLYRLTDWDNPPELQSLAVPLGYVNRLRRTPEGDLLDVICYIGGVAQHIPAADIWFWPFDNVDRQAFGTGMLHALASTRIDAFGNTVPPPLAIKATMDRDVYQTFHRYLPRYNVNADVGDDILEQRVIPAWEKAKSGQDFVNNFKEANVTEIGINSRGSFLAPFLEHIMEGVNVGLETPYMRLIQNPSSLADARQVLEAFEPLRVRMQKFIKRRYMRCIALPLMKHHGIAIKTGDLDIQFEEPDYVHDLQEMGTAFQGMLSGGAVHPQEMRDILRDLGVPLRSDEEFQQLQQQDQKNAMDMAGKGFDAKGNPLPPKQFGGDNEKGDGKDVTKQPGSTPGKTEDRGDK